MAINLDVFQKGGDKFMEDRYMKGFICFLTPLAMEQLRQCPLATVRKCSNKMHLGLIHEDRSIKNIPKASPGQNSSSPIFQNSGESKILYVGFYALSSTVFSTDW